MKHKNLLLASLLLITIVVVTIISCKKPENLVNPESISNNREGGGGGRVCCNGITTICSGTIMYFPTLTDFDNTVNCLEDAYEAWNTAFDNTYDSTIYTIDQWDDYADSIGFNEDEPLIEFEECTRFSSLRMYLDSLENEWEETHNLDSIHDPDLVTVIDDDIEQCLFNRFNEIAIGDTIYKFYADGTIIAIGGLDCNAIESVRKDSTFRNPRMRFSNPSSTPGGTSCRIWSIKFKQRFDYDNGNRRILGRHKLAFYPWRVKEVAKTINFRKKRGKFSRAKGDITVKIDGNRYDLSCNESTAISTPPNYGYRRKVRVKYADSPGFWQIKNLENYSTHTVDYWVGPSNLGTSQTLAIWW